MGWTCVHVFLFALNFTILIIRHGRHQQFRLISFGGIPAVDDDDNDGRNHHHNHHHMHSSIERLEVVEVFIIFNENKYNLAMHFMKIRCPEQQFQLLQRHGIGDRRTALSRYTS
jgi:hypothetical protein